MTEQPTGVKAMDASAQGQGVEKEFVVGLLVPGCARPMMEPTPNVTGTGKMLSILPKISCQIGANLKLIGSRIGQFTL